MKKEMTKVKFLGLVVIAGILMWYFCPWFSGLVGSGESSPTEHSTSEPIKCCDEDNDTEG